jgi:hypothetical protein
MNYSTFPKTVFPKISSLRGVKKTNSGSEPKIDLIKDYLKNNPNKLTKNELIDYFIPKPSNKSGGGEENKIDINQYFKNIKDYLSGQSHSMDNAEVPSFNQQLLDYIKNEPKKTVVLRNKLLALKRERYGPIDDLIEEFEKINLGSEPSKKWKDVKTKSDNVKNYETNDNTKEEEINTNTNLEITRFFETENIKESMYIFMVYIQRFIVRIYYILKFIRSIPVFGNILFVILLTSLYQKCFIFQIVCELLIKSTLTIADITGLTDVFYDVCYKILALFSSVASTYLPGIMNNAFESYFTTNIAQVISEQVATQVTTQVTTEVSTQISEQIAIESFKITQEIMRQQDGIQLLIELAEENTRGSFKQMINNAIANSATGAITNSATSVLVGLVNNAINNIPLAIANGPEYGGKPRRQTRRKIRRNKKAKTKKRKVNKKTKKRKTNKKTKVNRKKSKKRRTKK